MFAARSPLLSVIHHSAATPGLSSFDVDEVIAASKARNRQRAITGMLLAENGRFLQALEGPEDAVRGLMQRIAQDDRHEHVRILVEEEVPSRRFPDWAMTRGHVGEIEASPLEDWLDALQDAREELPQPPTRAERVRAWFQG